MIADPVFWIVTAAVKPLPQSLLTAYVTWQDVTVVAAGLRPWADLPAWAGLRAWAGLTACPGWRAAAARAAPAGSAATAG